MYKYLKLLIPYQLRLWLKRRYLQWQVRCFVAPYFEEIKIATHSFFIKLDKQNGYIDKRVYLDKIWESHIGAVINDELCTGDVFIDIGANIGYFSLLASKIVGDSGRVIAFEPLPDLNQQFAESVQRNKMENIKIIEKGCGDKVENLFIGINPENIGTSSVIRGKKDLEQVQIPISTLDLELGQIAKVDFVKIDVEGFEYEVLKGAKNILQTYHPKILIEFSPKLYNRAKFGKANAILLFLKDLGYRLHDVDAKKNIEDVDVFLAEIKELQTNILCY